MPKQEPTFEKDLAALEEIVSALEEGGLSLDDSLKRFELGVRLVRRCEKALGAAEKKIEMLTKNADGDIEAQPFGEDDAAEEAEEKPRKKKPAAPEDEPEPPEEEDDEELLF